MGKYKHIIFTLLVVLLLVVSGTSAHASKKVRLNNTKKTIYVNETATIKLLNNKKSVKWSTSNKNIKIISKSKKSAKIKAVKKGTSYLKVKVDKKTYKCKISIKNSLNCDGSRENPYSAYDTHTVSIYNLLGENTGKIKIKLIEYLDGEKANDYMQKVKEEKGYYYTLADGEEFVIMKFDIKCISSKESVWGGNIINAFYNSKANKEFESGVVLGDLSGSDENIVNMRLYKGGEGVYIDVHIVKKDNNPVVYNVLTGSDSVTWFTTSR